MESIDQDTGDSPATALPDLTGILLSQCLLPGQTPLRNAMRRVVEEVEQAEGHYAAHGSSPVT